MNTTNVANNPAIVPLANFLSATREFEELRQSFYMLRKNPSHMDMVRGFQARAEAQAPHEELSKEYARLVTVPEIARYLSASERYGMVFGRTIAELSDTLQKEMEA